MLKNTIIGDKLKDLKLDYSAYTNLPSYADIILVKQNNEEDNKKQLLIEKWRKVNYIRKHLKIVNDYIDNNKGETVNDWCAKNGHGLADHVKKEIGEFNNETGGISSYFYQLQNFHDLEETEYDKMEADSTAPPEIKKAIDGLRDERGKKRTTRTGLRKKLVKDLKKDGKGYLVMEIEKEPAVQEEFAADGTSETKVVSDKDKKTETTTEKKEPVANVEGEKVKSKIGAKIVCVAGFAIFITVVIAASGSTEKT